MPTWRGPSPRCAPCCMPRVWPRRDRPGCGTSSAACRVLAPQSRGGTQRRRLCEGGAMPMTTLLAELRTARVVPVVRTRQAGHAATAVQWLRDAGLRIFEITMTIPDAPALIRELAGDPALLVGAGTVADRATAETCLTAGARFIVAPWVDA